MNLRGLTTAALLLFLVSPAFAEQPASDPDPEAAANRASAPAEAKLKKKKGKKENAKNDQAKPVEPGPDAGKPAALEPSPPIVINELPLSDLLEHATSDKAAMNNLLPLTGDVLDTIKEVQLCIAPFALEGLLGETLETQQRATQQNTQAKKTEQIQEIFCHAATDYLNPPDKTKAAPTYENCSRSTPAMSGSKGAPAAASQPPSGSQPGKSPVPLMLTLSEEDKNLTGKPYFHKLAVKAALDQCKSLLIGSVKVSDNGYSLTSVLINVETNSRVAKVDEVLSVNHKAEAQKVESTRKEASLFAWVDGLASRVFRVGWQGTLEVDADRDDLRLHVYKIDDPDHYTDLLSYPLPNPLGKPLVEIKLDPGDYTLVATIGADEKGRNGRRSDDHTLALRHGDTEYAYPREVQNCEVHLTLSPEPLPKARMPGSRSCIATHQVVGGILASLGVIAGGFAIEQFTHSQTLANDASSDYAANGGYYKQTDINTISSSKTVLTNSKILAGVGAGLFVVGAATYFYHF